MRRVVVTGLGMVTPLGCGVDVTWKNLIAGKSGAAAISSFDVADLPARIACQVPRGDGSDGFSFNPDQWMEAKEQRKVDEFIVFGFAAAKQALDDAGWHPETHEDQIRSGVLIGSGIGGIGGIYDASVTLHEKGPRRISPFFIPGRLINLISGHVSIAHGLKGPNHSVVTACSTGAHAIGDAARLIALDDADVMVAGGAESPINRLSLAGFSACKALSTGFNDRPQQASRPYDKDRDGFVMGEGAGVLVIETLEHAQARGARIYCELVGYGATCDAYHITGQDQEGKGLALCLNRALAEAGIEKSEVGYINAHGTSTPINDRCETLAIKRCFGDLAPKISISSTKSMTGHLLGAAGGVEAAACVMAIHTGMIPPTINYENPDPDCDLDYTPNVAKARKVDVAISNNLGFGGHNASLIFKRL